MSEFTDKLGGIRQQTHKKGKIPKEDGKYILPDRRILIREGYKFTLVGHRDKKRTRQLGKNNTKQLRALLALPGYGGYTEQQLKGIADDELARMLNPKPIAVFHASWLCTSGHPEAKQLRKLVRQAEAL
jgi:hypothetical protein